MKSSVLSGFKEISRGREGERGNGVEDKVMQSFKEEFSSFLSLSNAP